MTDYENDSAQQKWQVWLKYTKTLEYLVYSLDSKILKLYK